MDFIIDMSNYKISNELQSKLEKDTQNNYRTTNEQIDFILNQYYEEKAK